MRILSSPSAAVLVVIIGLASSFHLPHSNIKEVIEDAGNHETNTGLRSQPEYTVFLDEDEIGMKQFHGIDKRGYYTCYNRQTTSTNATDCQSVIDRIKAANMMFSVPNGLCLTWYQGTCMSRLCAKSGAARGLNKTSDATAKELQDVILNDCIKVGLDGISGDCSNMVSNCGTYRMTLEHHGNEVLGGPPSN